MTPIEFTLAKPEEMIALAQLTAEWVKQGVTFTMVKDNISVQVKLTGGF